MDPEGNNSKSEEEIVEVEVSPNKKYINRSVQVNQDSLNTLIQQLTSLCAKKLSDANASSESPKPSTSNGTNEKNSVVSNPTSKSGRRVCRMIPSKKDKKWKRTVGTDMHFLYSMLPHMQSIAFDDKLDFKIEFMKLLQEYIKK